MRLMSSRVASVGGRIEERGTRQQKAERAQFNPTMSRPINSNTEHGFASQMIVIVIVIGASALVLFVTRSVFSEMLTVGLCVVSCALGAVPNGVSKHTRAGRSLGLLTLGVLGSGLWRAGLIFQEETHAAFAIAASFMLGKIFTDLVLKLLRGIGGKTGANGD